MQTLTSWLDLAGSLLLVAAVMVALWPVAPAVALAAGGLALLVLSFLIDRLARPRKPRKVTA